MFYTLEKIPHNDDGLSTASTYLSPEIDKKYQDW
jgi:hypothetical protein